MHAEKDFTLKESNYIDSMTCIRQIAEALNWELFCEKRPTVEEELVREFYVNLTTSELTEVSIQGIKQRVEEGEDPEEEEEDPIEIEPTEPMQSAEIPNKVEPTEPITKPDMAISTFSTQSPRPDLQNELSKLMDIMKHMQWQQQAY
ncbi:hypothetical protein PVK06_030874 [Gossypium arboreum]|uniref:Uncharacterized protein n=1 Tax=Gossypium arboreum TaxID=29729 RepID=A0ABR0NQH2_GOSAR|nr:hypothetical protein PVK06_030874 [Gossypium arboreum]